MWELSLGVKNPTRADGGPYNASCPACCPLRDNPRAFGVGGWRVPGAYARARGVPLPAYRSQGSSSGVTACDADETTDFSYRYAVRGRPAGPAGGFRLSCISSDQGSSSCPDREFGPYTRNFTL